MLKELYTTFLLALCLVSCTQSTAKWQLDHLKANQLQYQSARLYLPTKNPYTEPEIEFIKNSKETLCYINLHSLPVSPSHKNKELVYVEIELETSQLRVPANLMLGGQKLLLTKEASEEIITSLKKGECITVSVSGYFRKVDPLNFPNKFKSLEKLKIHKNIKN